MDFPKSPGLILGIIILGGCAHPIVISPDLSKINAEANIQKIHANVGYYVTDKEKSLKVTTPGGGGDYVSYYPYRDLNVALYKMLTNIFDSVTVVNVATDKQAIKQYSLQYIITPSITTHSRSGSIFTWPPTDFTVDLSCKVNDTQGRLIDDESVSGEGHADFGEFKSDFSLSGERASLDAVNKMQHKLESSASLRGKSP